MITPAVVGLARRGKAATVELTDQRAYQLARAWVRAWDMLAPEVRDALDRLVDGADDGTVTAAQIARDRRLAQALAHAQDTLETLAAQTSATVTADLSPIILAAADSHYQQLLAQLPPDASQVGRYGLGVLDTDAVDAIVARTTERIQAATLALAPEAVAAMRAELAHGIVVGDNPRTVARRILRRVEGRFNGGLARAERIARTEMLDAHRAADQAMAQRNRSVIAAAVWTARLDSRTCPACVAMHGVEFPPDEFGPTDHPQGRCTFIYRTKTWDELGFTGIEPAQVVDQSAERDAWWANLTDESQDAILGKPRADHLRNGGSWDDLVTRRDNPDWRPSIGVTPLSALSG